MPFFIKRGIAALIIMMCTSPVWAAGSVQGIGGLPLEAVLGPVLQSEAHDISADGSVVVGSSYSGSAIDGMWKRAFLWTGSGGMTALPYPAGETNPDQLNYIAQAISADGRSIVGWSEEPGSFRAAYDSSRPFIWTASDGMTYLWAIGEHESGRAYDVNATGTVVIGEYQDFFNAGPRSFRWTQSGGLEDIGHLGGIFTYARGVNADGNVIVGASAGNDGKLEAFRWTSSAGMSGLGNLGGESGAEAVDASGNAVVGYSYLNASRDASEPFLWTASSGMMSLGGFGGRSGIAWDISGNGLVVVGQSQNAMGEWQAFRWSEATGMQSVRQWLEDAGVDTTGFSFHSATATNHDGSVLVGLSVKPTYDPVDLSVGESWIARVSPIGSGIMNPQSFNGSLVSAQDLPRASEYLLNLPMNGAHHRPLMAYDFGADACGWVTADHAKYTREMDAEANTTEFGSCIDYLDDRLRIGIAAGKASLDQDLALGGSNDLDGYYVMVEADYRFAQQWIGSLVVMQGEWDVDADRAYLNGGSVDISSGKTDITELAVRARLDWFNAFALGAMQFSPRVAYTWTDTKVDDYAEVGGGFPVYFGKQSHNTDELRAGIDADWAISKALTLRGMLEGVYRFDDEGDNLQGQVIGLYSVTRPYEDTNESWVRVGAELEYRFSEYSLVSFSLNGASRGEDPDVSGAISFRMGF